MTGDVKKLSNKAPIILTWVPRVHGASLPDGKNSNLNYLDIIKNHKLKNKEDRDIYLVINGPGFEQNQIDDLKSELEGIKGVHVVDLHQYDWHKIDEGWKIDGKDINIKDFFRDMYSMQEEQRMYFAVEINTFRLIALALIKQFAKQGGAIYIDFDSLKLLNGHIGKSITIPKDILLGHVGIAYNPSKKEVIAIYLNNDLIAISTSSVAVDILSKYKAKVLSQEKMCSSLVKLEPFFREELAQSKEKFSLLLKEASTEELKRKWISSLDEIKLQEECLTKFNNNPTIKWLYEPDMVARMNDPFKGLNSGHCSVLDKVAKELIISKEQDKWKLFSFTENNGNYVAVDCNSDLSWMRLEDLYYEQQVSGKLEEAKIDQTAMEKLSLA